MSFYTSGLKTVLIDPIFDRTNFRSEFRLHPDTVYLPQFRLLNVGVTTDTDDKEYNSLTGAYGVIRSIELLDGNQLIDKVEQSALWSGFKNYKKDNNYSMSMNSPLSGNNMGSLYLGSAILDEAVPDDNVYPVINVAGKVGRTKVDANTTFKSWLAVSELLEFLNASQYIPTNVFKNLRLVINWETDNTKYLAVNNATSQTLPPVLVVDELVNPDVMSGMMKSYTGLSWTAIETDSVVVPAITGITGALTTTKTQSLAFTLNGFDNKTVGRMLLVNTPTSPATYLGEAATDMSKVGRAGSYSENAQKIQVVVNGSNKLPRNGNTRPNSRLALLNDTWGRCNTIPTANDIGMVNGESHIQNFSFGRSGQLDYFGIDIRDKVNELQLQYERTGIAQSLASTDLENQLALYNQQLVINCFAEVAKSVVVSGDTYNVVYM